MRTKLLLLFSAIVTIASAQNASLKKMFNKTRWTDGDAVYVAEVNGDFINMTGGTCHEGGYAFGLKCTDADPKAPWFSLEGGYWNKETDDDPVISFPCQQGSNVVTYNIDDETYLVVESEQSDATYCFRKMKAKEDLYNIIASQMKSSWTGNYRVAFSAMSECPEGSDCNITADVFQLGSWYDDSYQVGEEYESPSNIIKLTNGRCLKVMPHENTGNLCTGLSIFEVYYNEADDTYENEHIILVLDRKSESTAPRWPTDKRLMLPGEITSLSKNELRVMRNEIYARHGYRFGSDDLKEYFMSEKWYEMDSDPDVNDKIHFSLIEFLNIALIKSIEQR